MRAGAVAQFCRLIAYSSCTLQKALARHGAGNYSLLDGDAPSMKKTSKNATLLTGPADELRRELVRKITAYMGTAEVKATEVPGLTLHRRAAKTAPCPTTYQPSVIFIPQGRKQVDLGRTSFIYDARRFLLTSVDLPTVARVVDASEEKPCLAL